VGSGLGGAHGPRTRPTCQQVTSFPQGERCVMHACAGVPPTHNGSREQKARLNKVDIRMQQNTIALTQTHMVFPGDCGRALCSGEEHACARSQCTRKIEGKQMEQCVASSGGGPLELREQGSARATLHRRSQNYFPENNDTDGRFPCIAHKERLTSDQLHTWFPR
jgi:hypothetical protein